MTLKQLRQSAGKSVKEVAEKLCVTIRAVYNYENGNREISIAQIKPLAQLYSVSVEEIIDAQLKVCQPE